MTVVGAVSSLMRYPVKSMLGEELAIVDVGPGGVSGDRAYALVDDETGRVVSVKRPRRWGRIFELAAATPGGAGNGKGGGVTVAFPDGLCVGIDDPGLPALLSEFFGRSVSIATVPPPGATFDEAWVRELKNGASPYFDVPSRVEEGDELVDAGTFMSGLGNFFNFGAVHVVTTGTLRRLAELAPDAASTPAASAPTSWWRRRTTGSWSRHGRAGCSRSGRCGWRCRSPSRGAS